MMVPDQAQAADRPDTATADTPAAGDDALREQVIEAIRTVYDPEIPVNLYDLGLIYRLDIAPGGVIDIEMTLTAPGCPVAGEMPGMVQGAVETVEGVAQANVDLVFDPPWNPSLMSEDARMALGML
jgi:FeS assembly SUF system protein